MFILFRKHFFLFKEESEVLSAEGCCGHLCRLPRGRVWPPALPSWGPLPALPWAEPAAEPRREKALYRCSSEKRWFCPRRQGLLESVFPLRVFASSVPGCSGALASPVGGGSCAALWDLGGHCHGIPDAKLVLALRVPSTSFWGSVGLPSACWQGPVPAAWGCHH